MSWTIGSPTDWNKHLVAGFIDGRWVTTESVDADTLKISLYKEGAPSSTEAVLLDSVEVAAAMLLDWDQSESVLALRTVYTYPVANTGHIHIVTTDGSALTVATYQWPDWGYVNYYDDWRMRCLFVSADGKQVGITRSLLVSPYTDYLTVHSATDFSLQWELNINLISSPQWAPDYRFTIVGLPKENRVIFRNIDWYDSYNQSPYAGRYLLQLYNSAGTLLSSLYYWDPFYSSNISAEQWSIHSDGSLTYVRTKPDPS
jgi:hypothetical protein